MKTVVVTGSSGLIGTATCEKFAREGWNVIGVDNYSRGKTLQSKDAETRGQIQKVQERYSTIEQVECDIADVEKMKGIIEKADAIVHLAAQVSHPKSMEIPIDDARINILGTLTLLELTRKHNHDIPFAFMSSNKVYGDYPNYFSYKLLQNKVFNRYENPLLDSFNEELPIDRCGHTPFGVSKAAADLYCQEYARNYGMRTATFRGGCLVGANLRAVEAHGFLCFFTRQVVMKKKLKIFGEGYRVRDNMHASDVADVLFLWVNDPRPNALGTYGTPYNIGGGRQNSVSIFETIDALAAKTGIEPSYELATERESDHLWWITDMAKFKKDYPEWKGITKGLDFIFNELIASCSDANGLGIKIKDTDYFKRVRNATRS
ncbi:MAG: SDR family NAD(P)-dependent oxidoreductase [Candidatus Lokiarchaeota archaeon]|nr:SDR family NAD(P)-dependent oxidoreductase [Candidatus Lokiarchaeota archaeon]